MSKTAREKSGSERKWALKRGITAIVLFGALGGMMPSLLRVATSLSGDANAPLPGLAIALGIAAYGGIGAILAIVLGKTSTYDAFVTGIAAPAVIAGMIHGATDLPVGTKGRSIDGRDTYQRGDRNETARPSFGSGVLFALGGPRPQ